MLSLLIGTSAAAVSFILGYGLRRLNLKWEKQAIKAERRAEIQAAQLQATVSASLDGIIIVNSDGAVIDFSESAERIFGYKREDVLGQNMAELIVPERYRDAHINGMKRMRETGQSKILGQRIEIEAMRADGGEFMSELAISSSSGEAGDFFIAYIRDISARKAAQQELIEAKDAAEAASEAKSRFLATMSHEIRTPFNAVLGILDILGDSELDIEQRDLVKTAESSSIALLRIINDVLDYARMSSGQAKLLSNPFRANALFEDVIQLFKSQIEEKGLKVELIKNPDDDDIHLSGDIGRIRQVLLNFVSNAIKFTSEGQLTLSIDLEPSTNDQFLLTCSVSDTGIGIDEAQLDHVFDEFFMADDSETREYEGTGIGLTISKGLAELMGGTLGCESKKGEGSKFWVSVLLPVTAAQDLTDRYKRNAYDLENCRILVAEDIATNQMVIRHILERCCAELVVVNNGAEALDVMEQKDFDVILMDIFMPKLNGKETTKIIRASNNANKDMPIIALTAMGNFQDLDALREVGVNEVVTKPFKKESLFAAISSVMGQDSPVQTDETLEFSGYIDKLDADEIPIFREQLRKDLEMICTDYEDALKNETWRDLSMSSHALKGLAGTYGMETLSQLAATTNQYLNENDVAESGVVPPQENIIQDTLRLLKDYISNLDSLFECKKDAA